MKKYKGPMADDFTGRIGHIVVKRWMGIKVITTCPDMSRVKPSAAQLQEKSRFKEAVAYARSVLADPRQAAVYKTKIPTGQSVYHAAIAEYMRKPEVKNPAITSMFIKGDVSIPGLLEEIRSGEFKTRILNKSKRVLKGF
ncbi:hypothetical protein GS399_13090 [Pedobacter sp. HMF7647]|uniref:Uncharacterized protein n=1 Tax=Hufsiella arboris TaxID=2695275 RepID=A0A7K1YBF8_9SPHI|nr:hypothetical protein [Hufsiella arboris]MXV51913.1 hypothetical protein [Hufsiella arboris]